jgi:hypothetical protein
VSTTNDLGNIGGGRPPAAVINTNNGQPSTNGALFLTVGNNGASVGQPVLLDSTLSAFPAQANTFGSSQVVGIVTSIVDGVDTVQTSGIVELTAAQWAAVTGGGGLVPGNLYFVSATVPGLLTATKPVAAGSFQARVGVALSTTELLLQLSSAIGPHA